jgi:CO/xanthine dehydrogenase FAD-binding subunit
MIVEYHRPKLLSEALSLLGRADPVTVPIGGGSAFQRNSPEPLAVVDLQDLGLGAIRQAGKSLELGATVTLQALLDSPEIQAFMPAMGQAIELETTYNLRQVATIAGALVAADGRSPLATAFLALDAAIRLYRAGDGAAPDSDPIQGSLGELLPVRGEWLRGALITAISLPANGKLFFASVARTPADRPLVCAALARWPSGRTRLALGGYGKAPILALDGPEPGGLEFAARNAFDTAGDEWASAEYRRETAAVLARRLGEAAARGATRK